MAILTFCLKENKTLSKRDAAPRQQAWQTDPWHWGITLRWENQLSHGVDVYVNQRVSLESKLTWSRLLRVRLRKAAWDPWDGHSISSSGLPRCPQSRQVGGIELPVHCLPWDPSLPFPDATRTSAPSWLEHCFFGWTGYFVASLSGLWSHSLSWQLLVSALNYYTLISLLKFCRWGGRDWETSLLLQQNLSRALYEEQTWTINMVCLERPMWILADAGWLHMGVH